MRCTESTKLLSEYLDGELSPGDRESLESHLNECARCSGEYQAFLKIHESFKTIAARNLGDNDLSPASI